MQPSNQLEADTIAAVLAGTLGQRSSEVALIHLDENASYDLNWQQVAQQAAGLAAALDAMGVASGDRVAHVSENRYEWVITDLALHIFRAVHVPIHVTLSAPQIAYQVQHSGAKVLIASRAELIAEILPQLTNVQHVILFEQAEGELNCPAQLHVLKDVLQAHVVGDPLQDIQQAAAESSGDDLATILYTSGTTGEPKGVMLSQRNLTSNAIAAYKSVDAASTDLRLGILPLSHIYARTCDLYSWVAAGSRLAIARNRETVIEDAHRVQPSALNGVPYFYQKLMDGVVSAGMADSPGALRNLLGGAVEHCFCGGAALPNEVADFYEQQGLPLLAGYGLTESSPVIAVNQPKCFRRGSVGPLIQDIEVRIADDGEIFTKGPHVMIGYWQNNAATTEAIEDGWLKTGDLGHLDDDGFLFVRGRKKEIIVLATGKNVAPALVEGTLTASPWVEQAFVVGDDRKYLAALIVPSAAAQHQASEQGTSLDQLMNGEIQQRCTTLATYEQVRTFTLLERPFSIEQGELTAKLSLRRDVIAEHFRSEIDTMYREQ